MVMFHQKLGIQPTKMGSQAYSNEATGKWSQLYSETSKLYSETGSCIRKLGNHIQMYSETANDIQMKLVFAN